jgi:uncharacterized SAM-binding protein YcdF (DUF218 family)
MTGFLLTKIATQLVYPLSISIVLSVVGLVLLARGRSRRAGVLLGVSLAILWVASTPVVSFASKESLEARYAPVPPDQAQRASAIVVLGDAVAPGAPPRNWADLNESADRIVHASRLFRAGKAPLVVATGGADAGSAAVQKPADATADLLVEWGVSRDAILLERESRTTYENAIYTKTLLDARGIDGPVLLVTSAAHMWRSMLLFESAGITAIAAATDFTLGRLDLGDPRAWIPNASALRGTDGAIKEYLGVLVARLRGQIRGDTR